MATPEEVCALQSYRHSVAFLCKDRDRDEQERILRLSSLTLQQLKNAVTILVRHSEGKRKRQLENLSCGYKFSRGRKRTSSFRLRRVTRAFCTWRRRDEFKDSRVNFSTTFDA